MGTQLAVKDTKALIAEQSSEITASLPAHVAPEKFRRILQSAALNGWGIREALHSPVGKASFLNSAAKCAQDGLLPDGREAALVTYNTKDGKQVQYMPMVAGLQKAMRNSGEILSIAARVVYENDDFTYEMGDEEHITHKPADMLDDPGKPIGAYCIIKLKDGGVIREVMRHAEIETVRKRSKAGGKGPWVTDWAEMAKKAVIRRAYKRAPSSADVDSMIASDDQNYDLSAPANDGKGQTYDAASIVEAEAIEIEAEDVPSFDERAAQEENLQ